MTTQAKQKYPAEFRESAVKLANESPQSVGNRDKGKYAVQLGLSVWSPAKAR